MKILFAISNKQFSSLHILVKLMALICFSLISSHFNEILLATSLILLSTVLIIRQIPKPFKMLKRMRWLMLTLFLVYAFNTPGEYVFSWSPSILQLSPSYEGLHAGFAQALKLSVVILALSILLVSTPREQLIGGIYSIFKPLSSLSFFGKKIPAIYQVPERFAVRLWLTLHYVETNNTASSTILYSSNLMKQSLVAQFKNYFNTFEDAGINQANDLEYIQIQVDPLTWFDKSLMIILLILMIFSAV